MSQSSESRSAAERYFRKYDLYCQDPGPDSLFDLLEAAHSLNDRLKHECGRSLLGTSEFVALKAIRNLLHHKAEVRNSFCFPDAPGVSLSTDLVALCLVAAGLVDQAILETDKRWRSQTVEAAEAVFHRYDAFVNINPAIFNLSVKVYELVRTLPEPPTSPEYEALEARYDFENENGHSHLVNGRLHSHTASVGNILASLVAQVPSAV